VEGTQNKKRALNNVTASVTQEKTDCEALENVRNELLRSNSAGFIANDYFYRGHWFHVDFNIHIFICSCDYILCI